MQKLTLVALLALDFSAPSFAQDGIANSADIVKAANWNEIESITIEMTEHEFSPKDLTLKVNKPYRLVIKNTGEKDHYYTAPEFFKSVAWRKAQTPKPHGGEIKAPYFTAFEAYKKGGVIELLFVPVTKGSFDVICTIDDHKDKGMFGKITVQ